MFKKKSECVTRSCNSMPVCVDPNGSCVLHPALERPEGVSQQDYVDVEEFQQRTNAVSLERVKAYYRRLRSAMLHCITALQQLTHEDSG